MEQNIILLAVITLIAYFVVGNPYTYAVVSNVTGLKIKNKTHHMALVGIHSVVMTVVMYVAFSMLIKDKECPPPPSCPPPPPCPECNEPVVEESSASSASAADSAAGAADSADSADSVAGTAAGAADSAAGAEAGNTVEAFSF